MFPVWSHAFTKATARQASTSNFITFSFLLFTFNFLLFVDGVIIKKLNILADERGWLAEIWRHDEDNYKPVMSYVSVTKPGVVRGPHEHKEQSDCFVFCGPGSFALHLWDKREQSKTKGEYLKLVAGADSPTLIIVPPGIIHGYKCVSETEGWCLNFPDKLYRGQGKKEEPDEIRWEAKENSPYQIV